MLKEIKTHTGAIFVDPDKKLEFLTVGDYGKENNIKANFLGYTKEINGVQHRLVDFKDKWVATISTQKGCPMKCKFCDCPSFGFYGNASLEDLTYELDKILEYGSNKGVYQTERLNIHFARCGEPTFNDNVLTFTETEIDNLIKEKYPYINIKTIHPVISTMLPRNNNKLEEFLQKWCDIKNNAYKGEAGLQFSINSTDENQRLFQFNNLSLSLNEISKLADRLPNPIGRKYTLNFAVTKDTILNAKDLSILFDKNKFIVKITPIHQTNNALKNKFDVTTSYDDYDVYRKFEDPLLEENWDTIIFVPSKEEDSDRITCGNALIASKDNYNEKAEFYTLNRFYLGKFDEFVDENENWTYHEVFDKLAHYVYDYDIRHFTEEECKEIVRDRGDVLFESEGTINTFGKMLEDHYYNFITDSLYNDMANIHYPNLFVSYCDEYGMILRNESKEELINRIHKYYGEILDMHHKKFSLLRRLYRRIKVKIKKIYNKI